ncbi:MAG: hypothetical protein JNK58_09525 [Phycisphaerae bacterium]|nr:hypothetical protein [Phycisphaerae bacterium]
MRLLVERESGIGRVLAGRDGGVAWAVLRPDNVLADGWSGFETPASDVAVVAWSGTTGGELFASDPRCFGASAWERFGGACDAMARRGPRVIFRPHARHVLSDVQRVVKFRADRPRDRFGVALDASMLLEPSMLAHAADHYRRAFEALGPIADVVWLTGAAAPADEESSVRPAPLGEGVVPGELIVGLWRDHCAAGTPIVLIGDDAVGQAALIEGG